MDYRTWLVVSAGHPDRDEPTRDVWQLLRRPTPELGLGRPAIGIRRVGGRSRLVARTKVDADALMASLVQASVDRREGLVALSFAAEALLDDLCATSPVKYKTNVIEIDRPASDDPYQRRLVRLKLNRTRAPELSTQGLIVGSPAEPLAESEALFLDPVSVDLTEAQARVLASIAQFKMDSSSCYFLPPWRQRPTAASYFAAVRLELRSELRNRWGLRFRQPEEPVAVTMWRACDEPSLRDLLQEGASLRPTTENGAPLGILLVLPSLGAEDPLHSFRRAFLLGQAKGPAWTTDLARAMREDLESRGVLVHTVEAPPLDWSVKPSVRSFEHTTDEGSWQFFETLVEKFASRADRVAYADMVLMLGRPQGQWPADHALTEKMFCANLWQCPMAEHQDVWQSVVVDLVRHAEEALAQGKPGLRPPQAHLDTGNRWPRLERDDHGRLLRHLPNMPEAQLHRLRLVLPLGTRFTSGSTFRLDQGMRLDDGYVLA